MQFYIGQRVLYRTSTRGHGYEITTEAIVRKINRTRITIEIDAADRRLRAVKPERLTALATTPL